VYEEEGALWLGSARLGDEQDRPLVRSNGQPTYIAADIAYHLDKQRRGFRRVVDIWGPDHNGYVARTRAGLQALGIDAGWLELLILGPVTLKVDGLRVEGLNRQSQAIMLGEMIEELGAPAARLALLERPAGAPLELDLDLARRQSPENPGYRILSVCDAAAGLAERAPRRPAQAGSGIEKSIEEQLTQFPGEVRRAAGELEPNRLFRYTLDLAAQVHHLAAGRGAAQAASARSGSGGALAEASRIVLRNALRILGVTV
jgi:arginyl-tRNA synthetase